MKRILALTLALALCLCLFAACSIKEKAPADTPAATTTKPAETAPSDWDKLKAAGKMVIGITDYEPMNYYDANGKLIGFDTEYAEAVCAKLGIKAEFIEIDWDNKEIELNAGSIDCIWNGMTYTAERDENMDFADSYIYNALVVVIRSKDADKYKTTADLSSANLVAEAGSTSEEVITGDPDLSKAAYTPVDSLVTSLMEVAAYTANAAVVDSTMAAELVGKGAYADLIIIDGLVLSEEELAIGFRTGSDMPAKVNEITDDLIADGTLPALAEKYGVNLITD